MGIERILERIEKKKFQARQLCPNAVVISIKEAEKAVRNAYKEGLKDSKKEDKDDRNMEENTGI